MRQSAVGLVRLAGGQEDSADRRTALAADRTYAAWVRTGLVALASGVGAKVLFANILPRWFGNVAGSLLILFSVLCFVAAVWRELIPGLRPRLLTRRLPALLLIVANGLLVIVDIAALIGIWWVKT